MAFDGEINARAEELNKILESEDGKRRLREIKECAMTTVARLRVMRHIEPERLTRPITL